MSNKARPLGRKGFTLVELLIVVAIIGVLSTIGVPTFRRMIQKSKKSEAKVNLGGIYTAQQAFVAEYGTFGNNLNRMGYETDGKPDQMTYVVGFFSASCVPQAFNTTAIAGSFTGAGILPARANGAGAALNAAYPNYYANQNGTQPYFLSASAYGPHSAAVQNMSSDLTASAFRMSVCWGSTAAFQGPALGGGATPRAYGVVNGRTGSLNDLDQFVAMAAGVIAPGVNKAAPAGTETDVWSMDDTRALVNRQDGMK